MPDDGRSRLAAESGRVFVLSGVSQMKREFFYLGLVAAMALMALLPATLWLVVGRLPYVLLNESGMVESLGAIACLLASVFFFAQAKWRKRGNHLQAFWAVLFGVGCFFIAGEEVSWGQHLFNFEVPAHIAAQNFQQEFNIHNSKLIQSSNNAWSSLFMKVLLAYLLIFPLCVVAFPSIYQYFNWLNLPIPSIYIALIALLALLGNYVNFKVVYGATMAEDQFRVGEMMESLFQGCLLIVAIESWYGNRRSNLTTRSSMIFERND